VVAAVVIIKRRKLGQDARPQAPRLPKKSKHASHSFYSDKNADDDLQAAEEGKQKPSSTKPPINFDGVVTMPTKLHASQPSKAKMSTDESNESLPVAGKQSKQRPNGDDSDSDVDLDDNTTVFAPGSIASTKPKDKKKIKKRHSETCPRSKANVGKVSSALKEAAKGDKDLRRGDSEPQSPRNRRGSDSDDDDEKSYWDAATKGLQSKEALQTRLEDASDKTVLAFEETILAESKKRRRAQQRMEDNVRAMLAGKLSASRKDKSPRAKSPSKTALLQAIAQALTPKSSSATKVEMLPNEAVPAAAIPAVAPVTAQQTLQQEAVLYQQQMMQQKIAEQQQQLNGITQMLAIASRATTPALPMLMSSPIPTASAVHLVSSPSPSPSPLTVATPSPAPISWPTAPGVTVSSPRTTAKPMITLRPVTPAAAGARLADIAQQLRQHAAENTATAPGSLPPGSFYL
jgi:hypothetical protein